MTEDIAETVWELEGKIILIGKALVFMNVTDQDGRSYPFEAPRDNFADLGNIEMGTQIRYNQPRKEGDNEAGFSLY